MKVKLTGGIKTRRHHNNKGSATIRSGKTYKTIKHIARKMKVKNTGPTLNDIIGE